MNGESNTLTRVSPPRGWNGLHLRELWHYRELLQVLMQSELRARYKQTVVGIVWVLGQPLLTTIVLSVLVARVAGETQAGIPYPIFVYAALAPWAFVSHGLTKLTGCFVEQWALVSRVSIPRLLIPLGIALAAFVDFIVAFLAMPVLMFIYRIAPTWQALAFPGILVLLMLTILGIGLWLASFNAEYRDIAFALPFVLQIGMFVTPLFYSTEMIPLPWRAVYALNPLVGVVEGMRWSLLNYPLADPLVIFVPSIFSAIVLLASGLYIFQHREPYLADVI